MVDPFCALSCGGCCLGTKVGEGVGYCIRFDDMTSRDTKIKYVTDGACLLSSIPYIPHSASHTPTAIDSESLVVGMLLRETNFDPLLKQYRCVRARTCAMWDSPLSLPPVTLLHSLDVRRAQLDHVGFMAFLLLVAFFCA